MVDKNKTPDEVLTRDALFGDFVPGQRDSSDNPMMRSKEASKTALPKRFYSEVSIEAFTDSSATAGYRILLDGRAVRSPAKKPVIVPNRIIAEGLQLEWDAQRKEIDPATMPLTRLVNSTLDGVEEARSALLKEIIAYLGNDFLCYPATHPERLVERQKMLWQPILNWAGNTLGGRFLQASGILAVDQSPVMGRRLEEIWRDLDRFQLAAAHTIMTLTGSALLAYAFWAEELSLDAVWQAAMVDEDWNIELWGEDEEATKRRVFRRSDLDAAALVLESFRQ